MNSSCLIDAALHYLSNVWIEWPLMNQHICSCPLIILSTKLKLWFVEVLASWDSNSGLKQTIFLQHSSPPSQNQPPPPTPFPSLNKHSPVYYCVCEVYKYQLNSIKNGFYDLIDDNYNLIVSVQLIWTKVAEVIQCATNTDRLLEDLMFRDREFVRAFHNNVYQLL